MSLADTPHVLPKTTNPFKKKIKRVLIGLFVSSVVIVSLAAATLLYRPPWHTLTGSGNPGQWVARVECPENWQLQEELRIKGFVGFTSVVAHPKPLTGVWAWWNRVVLHQPDTSRETELRVFIMPSPQYTIVGAPPLPQVSRADRVSNAEAILDTLEMSYKTSGQNMPGMKTSFTRVSHPLGPAVAISTSDAQANRPRVGAFMSITTIVYDSLMIAPTEAGDFTGTVAVSYSIPPRQEATLKPVLERISRSIRLVKK